MQDASQEKTNVTEQSALEKETKKEAEVIKEILKEEKDILKEEKKAETSTASAKKIYPVDEEDKEMEAEILKALKEIKPLNDKIKCMILNTYLQEDKQLNVELEAELAIINAKYRKLSQPLIEKTNEIVAGRVPHEDELKNLHTYMTPEEAQKKDESFANIKPLEGYWLKVMKGSMVMKQFIQERDDDALKSLKNIKFTPSHDANAPHDFTLIFTFGPNEFFENEVLEKHFQMKEEKECKRTTATDIKWKEGKNLTKKSVTKKQKNKKTGKTRTVTKEVDCDSFFSFFKTVEGSDKKPHQHNDDESCSEDEHGDELLDHTDFGTSLLEEILPYHLEYYLGVKKDLDFGGGEGLDDEDDDDDDDGDDSEDEPKPKKGGKAGKKAPKGGLDAAGGAKQQQCNQQ